MTWHSESARHSLARKGIATKLIGVTKKGNDFIKQNKFALLSAGLLSTSSIVSNNPVVFAVGIPMAFSAGKLIDLTEKRLNGDKMKKTGEK